MLADYIETALNVLFFHQVKYLLGILDHVVSIPALSNITRLSEIWNQALLKSLREPRPKGTKYRILFIRGFTKNSKARAVIYRVIDLLQQSPFMFECDQHSFIDAFTTLSLDNENGKEFLAVIGLWSLPSSESVSKAVKVKNMYRLNSSNIK
jgi:hypothetical protein